MGVQLRSRRAVRATVALTASVALCLSVTPAALAAHGSHGSHRSGGSGGAGGAFPSQAQVDAARADAARKAHDVGAIKASLLMANQRLDQAATTAEQASEAYNGAMWRLSLATQQLRQAREAAARARHAVARQRDAIAALVATSYQQSSDLTALNAMLSANGPEGVLQEYAGFQGASTSLQADYQRFAASDAVARVFERKATQAKARRQALAGKARAARDQAAAAAAQAQAETNRIAAEKTRLIAALARAQNISVQLAEQRQRALEEIARRRAEQRARREALAAARARAAAQAKAAAAARAREQRAHHAAQSSGGYVPAPAPAPAPPPPAPSGHGGGAQAVAFAKAQLGEPYVWGAAGPSSWDCSGLTMQAWASAGVYLPHFAAAQYAQSMPISVNELRPGDLVFWTSNGAPSGIHHVAMYIGGGMIIQAPRTGLNVEIDPMYYWIPPNYFARP